MTTSPARASIAQTTACAPNSSASDVEHRGVVDGRSVDSDLVGSGAQEGARVLEPRHAAPDRERDRQLLGGALDELERGSPPLDRRRDVQEDELVRAELRIAGRELDRVPDVTQRLEADALDDPAVRDVEAGDQALLDHLSAFSSTRAPAAPLRSGWNWTPASGPDSTAATSVPSCSTSATPAVPAGSAA